MASKARIALKSLNQGGRVVKDHKNVEHEIVSGSAFDSDFTFGIELETNFDYPCPYEDYGDQFVDGFSGWDSRCEGTIEGVEVVSPILNGVAGIAEILITAQILEDNDGYMDRCCGQHVTVGLPETNETWTSVMVDLFRAYEEHMYAVTGDDYRYSKGGYGGSMKRGGANGVRVRWDGANPVPSYADQYPPYYFLPSVELRYPPGTLNPVQIALNIGLCLSLAEVALNTSPEEAQERREQQTGGLIARQIEEATAFFEGNGWRENYGLPYNVDDPPTVWLVDDSQGLDITHTLPNRAALETLADKNTAQFKRRLGVEVVTA